MGSKNKSRHIILTFLAGATVGLVSSYLSKKENRDNLVEKYEEGKNTVLDTTYNAIDDVSFLIENFDKDKLIRETKNNLNKINSEVEKKTDEIKKDALKKTRNVVRDTNRKIDNIQKRIQKKVNSIK